MEKQITKRRPSKQKKPQNKSVTKQQVRSMIDSMVSKEKQVKWVFAEYATTVSDSYTQFLVPIPWPAQGVQAYNSDESGSTQGKRIGNKIEFQDWHYNTLWSIDEESEITFVREIIFQWLQPIESSDQVPVIGDILQIGAPSDPVVTPLNYENRTKYHIISDKTFSLANNGYTAARSERKHITKVPVTTMKFIGDSQSGFSAGLIKGNLFVFVISDQDAIVGHPPTYVYSSAFYFTD